MSKERIKISEDLYDIMLDLLNFKDSRESTLSIAPLDLRKAIKTLWRSV